MAVIEQIGFAKCVTSYPTSQSLCRTLQIKGAGVLAAGGRLGSTAQLLERSMTSIGKCCCICADRCDMTNAGLRAAASATEKRRQNFFDKHVLDVNISSHLPHRSR